MDKDPPALLYSILICCFTAGQRHSRQCAPGETRTPNLLIRSQMLYPLSYGRYFFVGQHETGRLRRLRDLNPGGA